MNYSDQINIELEKIVLENNTGNKFTVSNILLFRDYLTCLKLWKINLGVDPNFIKSKPAHNLFLHMPTEVTADFAPYDDFKNILIKKGFQVKGERFFDDYFIYLYIQWLLLSKTANLSLNNLPAPYESVIKIIQRGGSIYVVNGQFEIDGIGYKNSEKYFGYRLPSLEDDFLTYIEENLRQRGTQDIPNQEETNRFYDRYINNVSN